jgi:hypothetical protein
MGGSNRLGQPSLYAYGETSYGEKEVLFLLFPPHAQPPLKGGLERKGDLSSHTVSLFALFRYTLTTCLKTLYGQSQLGQQFIKYMASTEDHENLQVAGSLENLQCH